ncbi:hypothetical protein [uncultured Desulfovibrio sp.]|uniref:hypothetical protein n=1 Tax=Desulfovibrio sp. TaxID=885 RepID=UPI0026262C68|nr:hypothetical protein [uncultured Desulfovibrio sp.]
MHEIAGVEALARLIARCACHGQRLTVHVGAVKFGRLLRDLHADDADRNIRQNINRLLFCCRNPQYANVVFNALAAAVKEAMHGFAKYCPFFRKIMGERLVQVIPVFDNFF